MYLPHDHDNGLDSSSAEHRTSQPSPHEMNETASNNYSNTDSFQKHNHPKPNAEKDKSYPQGHSHSIQNVNVENPDLVLHSHDGLNIEDHLELSRDPLDIGSNQETILSKQLSLLSLSVADYSELKESKIRSIGPEEELGSKSPIFNKDSTHSKNLVDFEPWKPSTT